MKLTTLLLLLTSILAFEGCYTIEDADDVNQERIQANYCTVFNGTRGFMKTRIDFRFGQTPLRMDHPIYFEGLRLYEEQDLITGLHYSREIESVIEGTYEWSDETGLGYFNRVKPYAFDLTTDVSVLEKGKSYVFDWTGEQVPFGHKFFISIESSVDYHSAHFYTDDILKLDAHDLLSLPDGAAVMTISRNYSEPVDEGTQAGGESDVSFVMEYNIVIK